MSKAKLQHVTLVGHMGSGKSTIGPLLGSLMDFGHVDLDVVIANRAGRSIGVIFEEKGEKVFRDLEEQALKLKISSLDPLVISTGGGIVERTSNRKLLKEESLVVWLRADIEALVKRVSRHSLRPLLKGKDPLEVLTQLDEERASLYEDLADIEIDTSNMKPSNVSELLFDSLKSHLGVENE
ncbi:MAG: shikimate kinase [Actinomycetota bacterium]|nr:shikimate kinase [Actinomycetota bacterium]